MDLGRAPLPDGDGGDDGHGADGDADAREQGPHPIACERGAGDAQHHGRASEGSEHARILERADTRCEPGFTAN
jgi:hypothetical protein